jgi:hypothetical protein
MSAPDVIDADGHVTESLAGPPRRLYGLDG